tara:strand:+ start:27 stop:449 length:423 start_codon:yes stop_codon:yes gene_type:complete
MATPEAKASLKVRLAANKQGCRLFRNNSGVAYDDSGRPVFFGLGNLGKKSKEDIRTPDDVGWCSVTVTPDMVGKKLAVFVAIDSKKLGFEPKCSYRIGTREYGQNKFFDMVINAGGIAGFAAKADHVDQIINSFYVKVNT